MKNQPKQLKIMKIEVENKFGKHYSWSTNMLLWKKLPDELLEAIKMELPNYQITNIKYE